MKKKKKTTVVKHIWRKGDLTEGMGGGVLKYGKSGKGSEKVSEKDNRKRKFKSDIQALKKSSWGVLGLRQKGYRMSRVKEGQYPVWGRCIFDQTGNKKPLVVI
jgi:hypothetical protein